MSTTVRTSLISPPPGQEDQSARLAASAEVGQVEGTKKPTKESAWSEFKYFAGMMFSSSIFWALIPFNVVILVLANWQDVMTWWAKDTPFSVVEDWSEFLAFVFAHSLSNFVDGLRSFFEVAA